MAGGGRRISIWIAAVVTVVVAGGAAGGTYLATRKTTTKPRVLGEKLCGTPPAPCITPTPTPSLPVGVPTTTPTPTVPAPAPTPTPTPTPTRTSTPAPVTQPPVVQRPTCLNSTDPSCGRFFWTPAPGGDQALSIRVAWSPVPATVGEPVTFTVTVDDGDAPIEDAPRYSFGDAGTVSDVSCPPSNRYGPWTTPARRHGHIEFTVTHTYAAAGRFVARFVAHSGHCGDTPYGDAISIDVPVTVHPADTASPSPSPSPQPSETPSGTPQPQTG